MKQIFTITFILGFFNLSGQQPCDTLSNHIWTILENPPRMNLTEEILEEKINSSLQKKSNGLENVLFIYVMYYVNCKGEDYQYKIATFKNGRTEIDSTSQFSESIVNILKNELEFEPGYIEIKRRNKIEKETVDFQGSMTIRFEGNKFHVLNEKESQKYYKKKR